MIGLFAAAAVVGIVWNANQEPAAEVNGTDLNTIYVSGHGFVQRSQDGGETWHLIENGMPNAPKPDVPDAHLMAQNPTDPLHLFVFLAQAMNNVVESKDGGQTWSLAGSIPPDTYTIAVGPEGGSTLLAGSESGLRQFAFAGGETAHESVWTADPTAAVLRRTNGEVIMLGLEDFQRSDTGKTWSRLEVDLGTGIPLGIRASHLDPDRLAIVTDEYKLYESIDGGQTWSAK